MSIRDANRSRKVYSYYRTSPAPIQTVGPEGSTGPSGSIGPTGATGATGSAGKDAYTVTVTDFVQPNVDATVAVNVGDGLGDWLQVGQIAFVETGGYYEVIDGPNFAIVPPSTIVSSFTFKNLGYTSNASPTTTISSNVGVSPGGVRGPAGTGLVLSTETGVILTGTLSGSVTSTLYTNSEGVPVIISGMTIVVTQALLGSGSLSLNIGLSGSGNEFLTPQTINSGTSVGVFGAWQSQLGAYFSSAQDYNAVLEDGSSVVARLTATGSISQAANLRIKVVGLAT